MDQREGEKPPKAHCRVGGAVSIGPSGETPGSRSQLYLDRNTYLHGQQSPRCLSVGLRSVRERVRGGAPVTIKRVTRTESGGGLGKNGIESRGCGVRTVLPSQSSTYGAFGGGQEFPVTSACP
jgi:hypothetical protein